MAKVRASNGRFISGNGRWDPRLWKPRSTSIHAQRRFAEDRRARYLSRIEGEPTDRQLAIIDGLLVEEWEILVAEHRDGNVRLNRWAATKHRLAFHRMLEDFERALRPQRISARAKAKPEQIGIAEHLEQLRGAG